MAVALGRADEVKLWPIEFGFFAADELRIVKRRRGGAQGQPVGLGDIVDMIGGDHAAGTRHVLHQNCGIARNMLPHAARIGSGEKIVGIAGQIPDDDANSLSLVKVCLREQRFKVQRVQMFKGKKKNAKNNPVESLNF